MEPDDSQSSYENYGSYFDGSYYNDNDMSYSDNSLSEVKKKQQFAKSTIALGAAVGLAAGLFIKKREEKKQPEREKRKQDRKSRRAEMRADKQARLQNRILFEKEEIIEEVEVVSGIDFLKQNGLLQTPEPKVIDPFNKIAAKRSYLTSSETNDGMPSIEGIAED
jgi:hypothetical protein